MSGASLVGTWKLVSFHLKTETGVITYPWGERVSGYLMYSEQGFVSVAFQPSQRQRCTSDDVWSIPAAEKASAYDTFCGYAGSYDFDGKQVTHHVQAACFPNWVGTDLMRLVELDGDRLSLVTPPMPLGGRAQTVHLVWERV